MLVGLRLHTVSVCVIGARVFTVFSPKIPPSTYNNNAHFCQQSQQKMKNLITTVMRTRLCTSYRTVPCLYRERAIG